MGKLKQILFQGWQFGLIALLLPISLEAQSGITSFTEIQCLRSTHGNNFWGLSIAADKNLSKTFALGIGIEYTYEDTHLDNGWVLTNLNFLPVYADERWKFKPAHTNSFYFHLSEGITFMSYDKSIPDFNIPKQNHRETGFYGYGGLGRLWNLGRKKSLITELGMKSFKITTNNLDVNPHGLTFRIGLTI